MKNSDEAIIVVNPTFSSVVDALKTIRLTKENNTLVAGVVLNMTYGRNELSKKQVTEIVGYPIIASIKNDSKIRKSLHHQVPLTYKYPRSRSSREFHKVARHLAHHVTLK